MARHTSAVGMLLLCFGLMFCSAQAQQETLTLKPTNATGPDGTAVTGAPTGFGGVSAQTATLGPCALRNLHTHAATEYLYVMEGSLLSIQFTENFTMIASFLTAGTGANVIGPQAVVYPAGRQHLQYNPSCAPVSFTAFFPVNTANINTVNIKGSQLNKAFAAAGASVSFSGNVTITNPTPTVLIVAPLVGEIALTANNGIPPAGTTAAPFMPVQNGVGTFAFPADLQGACIKRCGLMA